MAELDALLTLGVIAAAGLALGPGGGYARIKDGPQAQGVIAGFAQTWGGIFGVPAAWILAIAKVESNFRPGATNNTGGDQKRGGAWGCMQVTAQTAQSAAQAMAKLSDGRVKSALSRYTGGPSLLDPELGVMFGAFILSSLRRKYGDNFDAVASAYNRGAGNVDKLIAANKSPVTSYSTKAKAALSAVA